LVADVVGYTRLMEVDEERTLRRLRAELHELFEPNIAKHHGRLIKTTGDGLLAEFQSVVEAVRCAIAVQRGALDWNAALPEAQRIRYRIGINLGDVIVEDDDIYGDGVNVAARLEGLAEAGGVLLAGTAYDQIKKKMDVGFAFLGEQQVKNIVEPVRVYRVLMDPKDAGKTVTIAKKRTARWRWLAAAAVVVAIVTGAGAWLRSRDVKIEAPPANHLPLPDKPSIAVLPFANMSNDPKQEYFADGITDDLITDLSKVSGLFVIARNSTAKYKSQTVAIAQVSGDLGVRYVLEGTVQRAGDQIRINAQLIDSSSGGNVWSNRFDGSLGDLFSFQDRVTRSVAEALAVKLVPAQEQSTSQKETSVASAYDAFLKGWAHYLSAGAGAYANPNEYAKAMPYFEEAVKLDPNFGRAYGALALTYFYVNRFGWSDRVHLSNYLTEAKLDEYLREAKKRPNSLAYHVSGLVLEYERRYAAAYDEFEQAIALDPSDSLSYFEMARTLVWDGRPAEAVRYLTTAMRIDPNYPANYLFILGFAQFNQNRFEAAATSLEAATRRDPSNGDTYFLLAASICSGTSRPSST
jgi:adenylate cyclase